MRKLILLAFLCCVAVGLSACGDIPIENQIYAAQSTLTVAERGALAYVDQPLCGTEEAEGAYTIPTNLNRARIKTISSP